MRVYTARNHGADLADQRAFGQLVELGFEVGKAFEHLTEPRQHVVRLLSGHLVERLLQQCIQTLGAPRHAFRRCHTWVTIVREHECRKSIFVSPRTSIRRYNNSAANSASLLRSDRFINT